MAKEEQSRNLIARLVAKTNSGELTWQKTAQAGRFQVKLGNYIIQIAKSVVGSASVLALKSGVVRMTGSSDGPELSILSLEGDIIESYTDGPVNIVNYPMDNIVNLYQIAERSANGADRAISDILKLLK